MNLVGSLRSLFRRNVRGVGPVTSLDANGEKPCSLVPRGTQSFFQERGWKRRGNTIQGYYRCEYGSFTGKVVRPFSNKPVYYILDPPEALLHGVHGECFLERDENVFEIHFSPTPKNVNAGIKSVEICLATSLN